MGEYMDIAAYGQMRWWSGGEQNDLRIHAMERDEQGHWRPGRDPATGQWQIGLEWEEPRDVQMVSVEYAHQPPADVQVQYWRKHWSTPAPERRQGARRGWIGRDDSWHGQWTTVRGEQRVAGNTVTLRFDPIDLPELGRDSGVQLEEAEDYLVRFRRTLKLRVVSGGEQAPVVNHLQVFSTATWAEGTVDVTRVDGGSAAGWQAEAFNGEVVKTEAIADGMRLHLRHAAGATTPGDKALVTAHTQAHTFTFRVSDLEAGPLYLPDHGVYITRPDHPDFTAYQAQLSVMPASLDDRVAVEPEQ